MIKTLAAILALFVSGLGQAQTDITIPSQTCVSKTSFLDTCERITVPGKLYKVSGNAIVIVTHSSVGVDERHHRYARHLNSIGISAVVLDHWGARGAGNVQWNFVANAKRGANAQNMVLDVYNAAAYFKQNGYDKVGFIGESMGGGVGILLSKREWQNHFQRVSGRPATQLDAIASLYGNCNERYSYDNYVTTPLLILIGSEDGDTPAATCRSYTDYANGKGANFKFIELIGQYHDFDAGFSVRTAPGAQNQSRCQSDVTPSTISGKFNGKQYPNTPRGWEEWRGECIISASNNTARYGNTGNPNTGFPEWSEFFNNTLK